MKAEKGIISFVAEHPTVVLATVALTSAALYLANPILGRIFAKMEENQEERDYIRFLHGPKTAKIGRIVRHTERDQEYLAIRPRKGISQSKLLQAMSQDAEEKTNRRVKGK